MILTLLGSEDPFGDYEKLKAEDTPSIRREDLPDEFSDEAFRTVDEFIRKTKNLEFECVMYFDYVTGEILKFAFGEIDNVKLSFEDDEFEDNYVESIHNHPSIVYSPPSGKNFGILLRDFEDYELVVGPNELWVLKAKGICPLLNVDLKYSSLMILDSCQEYSRKKYSGPKTNDICDIMYGIMLSNYINDKNIHNIQLTKKEYRS